MRTQSKFGPFNINRTSQLCGLTCPMLDYLARTGVLVPSHLGRPGRGRDRLYSFGDVVLLRSLAEILKGGISVRKLRKAFQILTAKYPEITPTSLPARYLVTDGIRIFLRNQGTLEELSPGRQLAFAFVVKLEKLRNRLSSDLKVAARHRVA
jgi:DNA-binding transcriptional MerR regulator